jgi:hypothetical protein
MSSQESQDSFPEQNQRVAFCMDRWRRSQKMDSVNLTAEITKTDEEHRTVYGWASVITEGGEPVVDKQGDVIDNDTLIKTAHDFITDAREAKVMHKGSTVGEVVESLVLDKATQDNLGVEIRNEDGQQMEGWFIGMKVYDDSVWKKVKSGEYGAFSIGGYGKRVPITDGQV